jgi:methyl-accepting chemotaxis protein
MQTPFGPALLQAVPRDGLSVAADVSIIIVAVAVVVLAIVLAVVLVRLTRVFVEIRDGVRQHFGPIAERARGISENVEFISRSLREDVDRLNGSVKALTGRLTQASDRMEERIEDFNALMEVVQDEAEEIFIDTAATVRGVRAGARSIAGGRRRARADAEQASEVGAPEDPGALPEAEVAPAEPRAFPDSERAGALTTEGG